MFEHLYLRKVASEGINHHVEHCIFVPASRVLFSSRCPTFRVSFLSSFTESYCIALFVIDWVCENVCVCGRGGCVGVQIHVHKHIHT